MKKIALITVLYQPEAHLARYLSAIQALNYPTDALELFFVDNQAKTSTAKTLKDSSSKYPLHYHPAPDNLGFSGGNNLIFSELAQDSNDRNFDYYFLLNQDTQIDKDCLTKLVDVAEAYPQSGLIEAQQEPHAHPKYVCAETRLTSWCSGGGVLIRKSALEQVGYLNDDFFMYCEDVDLSWRMWLKGWECRLVAEAKYYHQTEELDQEKDQSIRNYYSFRNIQLINILYNSFLGGLKFYLLSWASLFLKNHQYFGVRFKAFTAAHLMMPAYLLKRFKRPLGGKYPWINFSRLSFGLKQVK